MPDAAEYGRAGVDLVEPTRPSAFELCRALAFSHRDAVLATEEERRFNVPTDLSLFLQLDEWQHPDVRDPECLPSGNTTFRRLALALETGDVAQYRPSQAANTHWSNWPDAGLL